MGHTRRPRVLVVDDEQAFADLLATFLEEEGYAVERAYDGEEALPFVESDDPPDLVLSDVMMPKLSGTSLLRLARRVHAPGRLPFLLLSAGPDPGVQGERVSFMSKPLDLVELLRRVEALVPLLHAHRA